MSELVERTLHGMTYRKLLTSGGKKHLVPYDEAIDEATTLCGCTITHVDRWKRIAALEGDECEKCADLTFCAPSNGKPRQRADGALTGSPRQIR